MKTYNDWLVEKFREWEKAKGNRRQSASAFARYLEVKQSSLSQWMAGNYPPTGENLNKLARKLGYEIYDILDVPHPEPSPLDRLPLSLRIRLNEAAIEIERSLTEKQISPDSPAGEQIVKDALRSVGLIVTDPLAKD